MIDEKKARKHVDAFMRGLRECKSKEDEVEYAFNFILIVYLHIMKEYGQEKAAKLMEAAMRFCNSEPDVEYTKKEEEIH